MDLGSHRTHPHVRKSSGWETKQSVGSGQRYMICVTLFCTLCEPNNTRTCENSTRTWNACDSRVCWPGLVPGQQRLSSLRTSWFYVNVLFCCPTRRPDLTGLEAVSRHAGPARGPACQSGDSRHRLCHHIIARRGRRPGRVWLGPRAWGPWPWPSDSDRPTPSDLDRAPSSDCDRHDSGMTPGAMGPWLKIRLVVPDGTRRRLPAGGGAPADLARRRDRTARPCPGEVAAHRQIWPGAGTERHGRAPAARRIRRMGRAGC